MVVAAFDVELPELQPTLRAVSEATIRLADARPSGDGDLDVLVWVSGATAEGLEPALACDPSVADWDHLAAADDRLLYRIDVADGHDMGLRAYRALVDLDGLVLDATAADGTWEIHVFLPDRPSLSAFYDRCLEIGLEPRVSSIAIHPGSLDVIEYGLTDPQRETLSVAAREGYFAVPKQISLVELAGELGVSDQAASERLRRGMAALVEHTILDVSEE